MKGGRSTYVEAGMVSEFAVIAERHIFLFPVLVERFVGSLV